jgi:hypothetical protein
MAVDYSLAPWLARQRTPGAGLLQLMQLQQRQKQLGMEGQRTQMDLEDASDRRTSAAQSALARKTAIDAIGQIPADDPRRASKVADIMRTEAMRTGPITSGMFPQQPPQVTDLTGGVGVPDPKARPSPEFTNKLADILKSAGAAPVPPSPPSGILPGSGKMITDSKGGVHIIPPRPLPPSPQMRPIPRGSIGMGPNGQLITNSPPVVPPQMRPIPRGAIGQGPDGKLITNSVPQGATSLPKLSDTELNMLPGADQTNYVNSIARAQTNRLGSASASAKDASKLVPAKTKVKNAKGEVKWTNSEGTLPDGWSLAQ